MTRITPLLSLIRFKIILGAAGIIFCFFFFISFFVCWVFLFILRLVFISTNDLFFEVFVADSAVFVVGSTIREFRCDTNTENRHCVNKIQKNNDSEITEN